MHEKQSATLEVELEKRYGAARESLPLWQAEQSGEERPEDRRIHMEADEGWLETRVQAGEEWQENCTHTRGEGKTQGGNVTQQ